MKTSMIVMTSMLAVAGCDQFKGIGKASLPDRASQPPVVVKPLFTANETNLVFKNTGNRTPTRWVNKNGVKALEFYRVEPAADKNCKTSWDTWWGFKTKSFKVTAGNEFAAHVVGMGNIPKDNRLCILVEWLDANDKPIKYVNQLGIEVASKNRQTIPSEFDKEGKRDGLCIGVVPRGAVKAQFGFDCDYPNMTKGQSVQFIEIAYYEQPKGGNWQFASVEMPVLKPLFTSPTTDPMAPITFEITSGNKIADLIFKLDHEVLPVSAFEVKGRRFTYRPTTPWKEDSVHVIDVLANTKYGEPVFDSVALAYTKRPVKHPKYTVRDDGMILRDGRAIFPIGYCRARPCNGNNYDIEFGIREAKKHGLDCCHTYYVQGTTIWGGKTAVEDSARLAEVCDNEDFMLYHEAAFRKPYITKERDIALAKNVFKFRERKCQWTWGIGDDTCMTQKPLELKRTHCIMKAMDPDSLTCNFDVMPLEVVSLQADYMPYADIFALETYPFRKPEREDGEIATAAHYIDGVKQAMAEAGVVGKAIIAGPQFFKGWGGWKRFPTKEELRCISFLNIACGARGFLYYASTGEDVGLRNGNATYGILNLPDKKAEFFAVTDEIRSIEKSLVLRDAKEQPMVKYVSGPATNSCNGKSVRYLLKEDGRFIAVNTSHLPVKVEFTMLDGQKFEHEFQRFGVLIK